MANTIFSCAVWCEVHGPTNIFCTQTVDVNTTIPITQTTTTSAETPMQTPASTTTSPSKGSCASCSMSVPATLETPGIAPVLKTVDGTAKYVSVRHPFSQERFKAIRSACIRALSCELVPGRSGPVFFGDPSIGYTIAYIFRLAEVNNTINTAQAGRRQYALMCTAAQEQELLQSWTFVTERFKVLAQKIMDGSKLVAQQQVDAHNHVRGSGESVSMDRDRSFLRPKGRATEKGLAELIGMEDIFVQLHAAFAWMLGVWRIHFEGAQREQAMDENGESSTVRSIEELRQAMHAAAV